MDSNNIVLLSIFVLATFSLIVFFKIRNKSKEKKIFSNLKFFAQENNCLISSYDHWDKSLIGISNAEHPKLFFIRKIYNIDYREILDLADVSSCKLVKEERHVNVNKEKITVTDKIGLVFTFHSYGRPDVYLEFYNNEYDQWTIWTELELAKKWTEIVKSVISKNQAKVEINKVNSHSKALKNGHYVKGKEAFQPAKRKRKAAVYEY